MRSSLRAALFAALFLTLPSFAQTTTIYASTNVWGSVAKAVGGKYVKVVSGVTRPEQDPHDYEATAHDKLAVSKASLLLVNGGGYDDWALKLGQSVAHPPKILNAVALSGLKPAGAEEFNEHVFYSLPSVKKVAHAVALALSQAQPKQKAHFLHNEAVFDAELDRLQARAERLTHGQQLKAIFTEPVVGYLLQSMHIQNITPETFVEQSETDAGPSAKALLDTQNLLKTRQAQLLVLNAQTVDDASKALQRSAQAAQIPVVEVYETFPNKVHDYPSFIAHTLDAFAKALQK